MESSEREASAGVLEPGLYVVATPIGAARDVTLRALDILRDADIVAAEDTRTLRKLLEIHGVRRAGRLVAYHDHNGAAQRPGLLRALNDGRSIALVSDAGTPLIADPGFKLVEAAAAAGHMVRAAPGASAVLAALSVAGLPTERFLFAGFPPPRTAARRAFLAEVAGVAATLVFYESPRRLAACLADMADTLGADRPAVVCRELTKRFEETWRGSLAGACGAGDGGRAAAGRDRDRRGARDARCRRPRRDRRGAARGAGGSVGAGGGPRGRRSARGAAPRGLCAGAGAGRRAMTGGRRAYFNGVAAEEIAARIYSELGGEVIARRWRSPAGEIDLVVRLGGALVFVEVKARRSRDAAAHAISPAQWRRLGSAAELFMDAQQSGHRGLDGLVCRFDAVLVDAEGRTERVENAYSFDC